MKLTQEIIESYGFECNIQRPDWDDISHEYTLPNGLVLTGFVVLNNRPCKMESLEGIDGYIYIETKEELDELLSKTSEVILNEIKVKYPDFYFDEWL